MMKKIAPVFLALASCGGIYGGTGQTSAGDALVSEYRSDMAARADIITVTKPGAWVCTMSRELKPTGKSTLNWTVPVTCNNGLTGTSTWVASFYASEITATFALSNGERGSVTHQFAPKPDF